MLQPYSASQGHVVFRHIILVVFRHMMLVVFQPHDVSGNLQRIISGTSPHIIRPSGILTHIISGIMPQMSHHVLHFTALR